MNYIEKLELQISEEEERKGLKKEFNHTPKNKQ